MFFGVVYLSPGCYNKSSLGKRLTTAEVVRPRILRSRGCPAASIAASSSPFPMRLVEACQIMGCTSTSGRKLSPGGSHIDMRLQSVIEKREAIDKGRQGSPGNGRQPWQVS